MGKDAHLAHYMALRQKYGVHRPVDDAALDTFVGARVFELSATVSGSIHVNSHQLWLIQSQGGTYRTLPMPWNLTQEPEANPTWRILVKAERHTQYTSLQIEALDAVGEAPVAAIDAEDDRRIALEAAKRAEAAARAHDAPVSFHIQPSSRKARRVFRIPLSEQARYYAAFIKHQNSKLSNGQALRIANSILGFSHHFGIDARLIMAMVMVESGFDPNATSRKGALGLGQLMPFNARDLGLSNAYDTDENLYGTVRLVRYHLKTYLSKTGDNFRSLVLMLAAYNAGEGAVARYGGVPPYRETQAYIRRIISLYRKFCGYG